MRLHLIHIVNPQHPHQIGIQAVYPKIRIPPNQNSSQKLKKLAWRGTANSLERSTVS